MKKILMVCLGNICRSPLAEGIMRHKLGKDYVVDSAGTSNYHINQKPDTRSIKIAKQHGIDISNLKGRQFSKEDFKTFDLIYAMDNSNYQDIIKLADSVNDTQKVHLILDILDIPNLTEVPDPYTGDLNDFEYVYSLLDRATSKIAESLKLV